MKRKTHSGAKKRFKISPSGKVRHRATGKSHLMTGKSGPRVRRMRKWRSVEGRIAEHIRRQLLHA